MPLINLQPSGALRPELATDAEVAQAIAAHKAKVDEMISQSLIRTLSVMSRTGGNTGATIDANTTIQHLTGGKIHESIFCSARSIQNLLPLPK
ncbi:MAG: hypothetical protein JGK26_29830 [Microcoleus sp. PH2017_27_LUM_O_A]|uniref:hypothetical protein n=1 Tax=Microcoleus sp. PH2017_27_LUM_O_A TaxID=2798837 RepID=UPI001DBF69D6|nr:hypothetical protein [Microcoleus sp. PH2017_27_LUM_O_A]MCC3563230.1 hypothetical protein [Microcoleus sp. PH2017_27_LUM_O_A]